MGGPAATTPRVFQVHKSHSRRASALLQILLNLLLFANYPASNASGKRLFSLIGLMAIFF